MKSTNYTICLLSLILLLISCKDNFEKKVIVSNPAFDISDFQPLENFGSPHDSIKSIAVDWSSSMDGIEFPGQNHTPSGYFRFSFRLKNKSGKTQSFRYKIYYQNDSYCFEAREDTSPGYGAFQSENFYGSWEDTSSGYHFSQPIPSDGAFHTVSDSFRIVGNPRFESRYFANGINQPWQRNPRMGTYSFMLLVCHEGAESRIPDEAVFLNKKRKGFFVNPFDELIYRLDSGLNGITILKSQVKLQASANLDMSAGIYIDENDFDRGSDQQFYCASCGTGKNLNENACFKQFRPTIISDTYFDNIPLIEDVNNNQFTREDYYWNKNFTPKEERIRTIPMRPRAGCETVKINSKEKSIELRNPASKPYDWRKEISGVKTRHGFSYGKVRVKCKLPRLLNDNGMWNGLTNAIWLINQSLDDWNQLRPCKNGGYMAEYLGDENSERKEIISYSEIDFEIIKAHPYCPGNEFPPFFRKSTPVRDRYNFWLPPNSPELEYDEDKILVACTNWDMACQDPGKQAGGCVTLVNNNEKFSSFRWGKSSRATTGGQLVSDKDVFGRPYYYFEIEWKPTEIIWRIGPEPNQMRTVCYMDSSFTSIPNNQMLLIVDQEFHNTKWWFGAPFEQENIPFPAKEILGKIYEVTIE